MKILFVVGGSYKNFYINNLKNYKNIDLLIFQEGLIYTFDFYEEYFGTKLITNEMKSLAKILNCKIIAKVTTNLLGVEQKEILYADKNGVKIISSNRYLNLFINNKTVLITNNNYNKLLDVNIFINNNSYKHFKIKSSKAFLVCGDRGVICINKSKKIRKFRKICYFTLNF